ncbi:MAG TPA: Hsp20/alpha crystallin family protein [Saprospiraceae bacterium]|nr:Hsp20/alpha crystallin family protein [Saprospiraceae bacterium]MCB9268447.1 Hsp20/alpha crystallin family protein [Lewinellaceae bacterium]HPG08726.1 Hsp20/alpha crystallin family protein [Saprospiraceae bacterium]HPQ98104.1 Hsp20/alpha crystallin family protein [Saprospiraceae bacterium]HRV85514.1 Hsp20/alpha crystallin family protein [Saprospiraceae bacterium]
MHRHAHHWHGQCGPSSGFHKHAWHSRQQRRPKYNVPLNIIETDETFEVNVFAPGFDKSQITLSVADDVLYILGSKPLAEGEEPDFILQEFPIKSFERRLALNGKVDTTGISAKQENQVLIISLPKSAEAKREEIKIDVI